VTLRLTAGMYHRFHAPHDCAVESVHYVSGDTWNVNPIALARVERLFCKNERALILARLAQGGAPVLLAAVGAILVASVRLTFLDDVRAIPPSGTHFHPPVAIAKGAEMGWFEHGSTIILFAPGDFRLCEGIAEGASIRAGARLMHVPEGTRDEPDAPQ
jgi:phosphatidylserine decarboxylase